MGRPRIYSSSDDETYDAQFREKEYRSDQAQRKGAETAGARSGADPKTERQQGE